MLVRDLLRWSTALALALGCQTAGAQTTFVIFGEAPLGSVLSSYTESGFEFSALGGSFHLFGTATPNPMIDLADQWITSTTLTPITVRASDGSSFSLNNMAAAAFQVSSVPTMFHMEGVLQGGGTLSLDRSLPLSTYSAFELSSTWANLSSVTFSATTAFSIDSLTFNAPFSPEPPPPPPPPPTNTFVTFDSAAREASLSSYTEGGLTFSSAAGAFHTFDSASTAQVDGNPLVDLFGQWISTLNRAPLLITAAEGTTFSLGDMAVAPLVDYDFSTTVHFEGLLEDGSTLLREASLDDTIGFQFDGRWTNLRSVSVFVTGGPNGTADFSIDSLNVSVTTPIPEPETYAMLLAGLTLLGFYAQRRRKSQRCFLI